MLKKTLEINPGGKREYLCGEALSLNGITASVFRSDGYYYISDHAITEGFFVLDTSAFRSDKPGEYRIIVYYAEDRSVSGEFTVTVRQPATTPAVTTTTTVTTAVPTTTASSTTQNVPATTASATTSPVTTPSPLTTTSQTTTSPTATTTAYQQPSDQNRDLNGNGKLDIADAVLLLRYITEDEIPMAQMPSSRQLYAVDLDEDGCLTVHDVMRLLSVISGLASSL